MLGREVLRGVISEALREPGQAEDGVDGVPLDRSVPGESGEPLLGVRQLGRLPLDRVVCHEVGEAHGGGGGHWGSRVKTHVTVPEAGN